jgi:hypothetical protein
VQNDRHSADDADQSVGAVAAIRAAIATGDSDPGAYPATNRSVTDPPAASTKCRRITIVASEAVVLVCMSSGRRRPDGATTPPEPKYAAAAVVKVVVKESTLARNVGAGWQSSYDGLGGPSVAAEVEHSVAVLITASTSTVLLPSAPGFAVIRCSKLVLTASSRHVERAWPHTSSHWSGRAGPAPR